MAVNECRGPWSGGWAGGGSLAGPSCSIQGSAVEKGVVGAIWGFVAQ